MQVASYSWLFAMTCYDIIANRIPGLQGYQLIRGFVSAELSFWPGLKVIYEFESANSGCVTQIFLVDRLVASSMP